MQWFFFFSYHHHKIIYFFAIPQLNIKHSIKCPSHNRAPFIGEWFMFIMTFWDIYLCRVKDNICQSSLFLFQNYPYVAATICRIVYTNSFQISLERKETHSKSIGSFQSNGNPTYFKVFPFIVTSLLIFQIQSGSPI